jgi:hypothetical protein
MLTFLKSDRCHTKNKSADRFQNRFVGDEHATADKNIICSQIKVNAGGT